MKLIRTKKRLQIQQLEGVLILSAGCRLQLSNRFGADLNKIVDFYNEYLTKTQAST